MKHNLNAITNQRLDRVTNSTLVVGVDIAKETHVAQVANFRGRVLNQHPICCANSESGFTQLMRSIRQSMQRYDMNDVIVGMESTGHYFFNLANWLTNQGIDVVLVNPATTKRNKENRDNTPSKSDPKDAVVIADLVGRGYYTPYEPKDPLFQRLNVLAKARERIVKDLTRVKNRIHGWIDVYFPEYTSVFKDPFVPRSLATLDQCPTPADLAGLSPEDVVNKWAQHGMKRPGGARGLAKAVELLRASKRSVGSDVALEEAKWELAHLLEDYQRAFAVSEQVEAKMESTLQETPLAALLETVGMTQVQCACILAFGGDISKLDHGNQLLRMAGLNLAERSSGKYVGKIKLSKRGNPRLRKYLFLVVIHLLKHSPTFRRWHRHNVDNKGMKKMASVIKLMGKLARILVAMARKSEVFKNEMAERSAA